MNEKKELSVFDREQLDLIGNLFSDIIENPSKHWSIKKDAVNQDTYMVHGQFTLVEVIPPIGDKEATRIKVFFLQKIKLEVREKKFDANSMPDNLSIQVNDKEYLCDFKDSYLNTITGIKRLQQVLHKKGLELLLETLQDNILEGENLISMLKAVKEHQ